MESNQKQSLGDRHKAIEQVEAGRRADGSLPIMMRLDGHGFSKFTRGLIRPFDARLSQLMIDTTSHLVRTMSADLGYTQSDEITLVFLPTAEQQTEYLFGGKYQKLCSLAAARATGFFNRNLSNFLPEKAHTEPEFDCRVWNVPSTHEAYLNVLSRQDDAIKNSISMAAQAVFSHKKLLGANGQQKRDMLKEAGNPWEDRPVFFKSGTFLKRRNVVRLLTDEEFNKIPERHRPETREVIRSEIYNMQLGPLRELDDPVKTLFERE